MGEKSLIRRNAEKDPDYAPYCLRCSRGSRMRQLERFLWWCPCGARHDERRDHVERAATTARTAIALDEQIVDAGRVRGRGGEA